MSDEHRPPQVPPSPEDRTTPQAGPAPGPEEPPAAGHAARRDGFGRVVRHRATQLVAVGLLGLVVGGGLVGTFGDRHEHRKHGGFDRPGHSRFDERGPGKGFEHERGFDR